MFPQPPAAASQDKSSSAFPKIRKTVAVRVHEAVKAIALCHNVTPVYESRGPDSTDQAEAEQNYEDACRTYQAASPDEVSHLCNRVTSFSL